MKIGKRNKRTLGSSDPARVADPARVVGICRNLNAKGARYLVIGSVACQLHGMIRATKDIDLLIPKDPVNAEAILAALKDSLTFGIAGELDADTVVSKPFTIVGDMPRVDLLTVANRVKYDEAAKTALETRIGGVRIPYPDLDTLIKSKQTNRAQDLLDIERLRKIVGKKKRRGHPLFPV